MRTSIYKVAALSSIYFLYGVNFALAAPTRYECLEKIGSSATKEQLDLCVSGGSIRPVQNSSSITASEEATCIEMGFKRKTESFGNCVLELMGRKDTALAGADPDGATCIKYGFKPKSSEYASCRLQIDQARQQAQQNQAQFLEQKRAYDKADKQRRIDASMKLMDMGQRIASGQNGADAYRQANGLAPLQSPTPPMQTQTYMLPNNKMMTCTTAGSVTNCF
jgi:hypothetical protein